jgi:hypothetical protein
VGHRKTQIDRFLLHLKSSRACNLNPTIREQSGVHPSRSGSGAFLPVAPMP